MKEILLVTRPIAPPWDEASKNFAYFLARSVSGANLTLLTHGIIKDLPANVRQLPIYTSNRFNIIQKIWLLASLIRKKKDFQIIHFLFTPTRINTFLSKLAIRGTLARTIQTVATLREDLYSDSAIRQALFADLIITYSEQAKTKLKSLGFKDVRCIYPGIDLERYSPAPADPAVRERFGIGKEEFVVTYPGEFTRLGATDALAEMIIRHKELWKERKVRFVWACRVKNGNDLRKKSALIERLKAADCLSRSVFTDTFADMPNLFRASDVVIFPARDMRGKFDIPLAAIEPMACAKPVIVSDLHIFKEFAKTDNSLIIDRNDFDKLKDAILELQSQPAKASALGATGRRFVENNFDIRKVAAKYQEIYDRL